MSIGHRSVMGLAILVGVAIAGCARAPVAARSVPYLRAHPKVLQALVRRCAADPGHLEKVPACVNAREAALLNGIGSFRRLRPLVFPPILNRELASRGGVAKPAAPMR